MARKSYRKDRDEHKPRKKYYGKKRDRDEEDDDPDEEEEERGSRRRNNRGGKRRRGKDSDIVYITGLFKSESGKAYRVFLEDKDGEPNEEIIDKLKDAAEDAKVIGISRTDYGYSLWYIKKDED